jgi:hypothetical protein
MMAFEVSSVRTINQPQETKRNPDWLDYTIMALSYFFVATIATAAFLLSKALCNIGNYGFDAEMAISMASASVVGLVGFGGVTFFCYKYSEKHFKSEKAAD